MTTTASAASSSACPVRTLISMLSLDSVPSWSHATHLGIPDKLVQLQLEADGQPVGHHPLGEHPRVQFTKDGTEQDHVPVCQCVLADLRDRPFVVPAVLD